MFVQHLIFTSKTTGPMPSFFTATVRAKFSAVIPFAIGHFIGWLRPTICIIASSVLLHPAMLISCGIGSDMIHSNCLLPPGIRVLRVLRFISVFLTLVCCIFSLNSQNKFTFYYDVHFQEIKFRDGIWFTYDVYYCLNFYNSDDFLQEILYT